MKWLAPAAMAVVAVLAELLLARVLNGSHVAVFVGRFHPLVVHLPIGFFVLVAMAEMATFVPQLRPRVEPVLGLLLPVSAAAALVAFLFGQLLAIEGGFPLGSLSWHRRLTLIAVIGIAGCWAVFDWQRGKSERGANDRRNGGQARWLYRALLAATLGVLSLGAHFGGTMTRGDTYLSEYAPGPLKFLLGGARSKPAENPAPKATLAVADPLLFQDVVLPILTERCVGCHGAEKQKGKLRLDSLEQILKGGEKGAVVTAGLPAKSPLLQRTLLPASDDDRMPPEGKPAPKADELALIQFWIERGATATLRVRDVLAPAASRALLEHALLGDGAAKPANTDRAPSTSASAAPEPVSSASKALVTSKPSAAAANNLAPLVAPEPSVSSGPPAAVPTTVTAATSGPAVLAAHCVKCHGPEKQKGKLRVDSMAALLQGGADGPALVPGSAEKSSLLQRVRLPLADDDHMPPRKEPQLSSAEIATLAAWVRASTGAALALGRPVAGVAPPEPNAKPAADAADSPAAAIASGSAAVPPTPSAVVSEAAPSPAASCTPDPALLQGLPSPINLFSAAIQPLLREKCGKCHIGDKTSGGLSLAQYPTLVEGGFSGPAIVPKDRGKSLLLARLALPVSEDEHMPPEGEPQLNADEVELLSTWIDQGAPAGATVATGSLSCGAVRVLAARASKPGPRPLAVRAGGCGACGLPGTRASPGFDAPAIALSALTALALLSFRRRRRALS